MNVRISCHEEIRPASSMTSQSAICSGDSSRTNCNSDLEQNVSLENLEEMFPHIAKHEIMEVLQITGSQTLLTPLWKLITVKLQEKNPDDTLKCIFLSYKSKIKIQKRQRLKIINESVYHFPFLSSFYFLLSDSLCGFKFFLKEDLTTDFIEELGIDAGIVKIEIFLSLKQRQHQNKCLDHLQKQAKFQNKV